MIIFLLLTKTFKMIKKNLFPATLFAILATVLTISWFKAGLLYGGGDVGIPSYDPQRIFDITKFVWWDASAPGTTVPQGLTSVPFQFIQMILQKSGLSYMLTQASFFWMVIFLIGYGMFLMAGTIFGKEKKGLAVLAGLFYLFNPYMMIEIWHRFIHNTFFLAAALPFIFILWTRWIRGGRFVSLLTFLLISFLSSYMFGTLAFIVVIVVILAWVAAAELLPWKNFANLKQISSRFFFGGIFWFLIQAWWMFPSFGIAPALLSAQHSVEGSLSTLLSISEQTIIPYSIFGINPFYLYIISDFGPAYNSIYLRLIPFFVLLFLIPGFIKSLMSKTLSTWGLLFILGIFLAKGAAAPFGNLFIFGFSNIFALGVLRNPFEKLGILIPFSGAILFALGVNFYLQNPKLRKKRRPVLLVMIIILALLFVVFQWPVWSGKLFGTLQKPAYVEVPSTYIEADEYIRQQDKNGNILHLPLTTGEAATYYWKHGFSGVESSQLYFSSLPSISRGFNIAYVDDALSALSAIFTLPRADNNKIIDLLRAFNVRFIILHKDMEWRGGLLSDPEILESTLNSKDFLKKEGTFGDLTVYRMDENNFAPKLRLSQNLQYVNPGKENSYWPWLLKQGPGDLVSPADKKPDGNLMDQSTELLVLPAAYSYSDRPVSAKDAVDMFAAIKVLPGSPLYFLVWAKEGIKLFSMNQTEKLQYRITLAGKRLAESFKVKEKKPGVSIVPFLRGYQKSLVRLSGLEDSDPSLGDILARHLAVLDYLISALEGKEKEEAIESKRVLTGRMKPANLLPQFEIKENQDLPKTDRLISAFQIPYAGTFEVLMALQNGRDFYQNGLMKTSFQIDDSVVNLSGLLKDPFISYGYFAFTPGLHEISFYSALSDNMFDSAGLGKEFEVVSEQGQPAFLDFEIKPVTGGGWYQLSFASRIKSGEKFKVQLIQDSDPLDNSEDGRYMSFNKKFRRDSRKNGWNRFVENIYIKPATTKATVRFLLQDSGAAVFRDIEIKRVLRNPLFLRTILPPVETEEEGILEFEQRSAVFYLGKMSIKNPKFLIFAGTFHPGWVLKLNDGTTEISLSPKYTANLYSNAFYIEKAGDYTFSLEFVPQQLVNKGIAIALGSFLAVSLLVIWQRFKKV